jgi:hypothetical protein
MGRSTQDAKERAMTRRLLAVTVIAVVLCGVAAPSWAGFAEDVALARIIAILHGISSTMRDINDVIRSTRDTLDAVYPAEALSEIRQVFNEVRSIEGEITALSCDWRFSAPVQRFWDGIFRGLRLCKGEWQAVFGAPPRTALQDLDEYEDYQGVRRMNMVASRVESGKEQQDFLKWLFDEAEKGRDPAADKRYGPGYSQRLSALGAAALGNVLLEQGDTLTAELELEQERVNAARLRKRLQTEFAVDVYGALAGEGLPAGSIVLDLPGALR